MVRPAQIRALPQGRPILLLRNYAKVLKKGKKMLATPDQQFPPAVDVADFVDHIRLYL